MADLSLKYLLFGEDKTASKAIKGVAGEAEKSSSKMTAANKAIAAGALFAGAAAIKFGKDSVDAYLDAEKQHRVLEDAYKRFPAINDVNIASMDAQAEALMNVTKFDDDAISSSQGLLAQYKLTGAQIQQLIPLVLDYAQKTGKDLPTATEAVGKALLGQGRALKEIGINFHDTGTTAGNFTELMGGLRTQVGGFAEQEGKSAEGRAAILANRFGNLQEEIGERLLPAIEFTVAALGNVVSVASAAGDAIGSVPMPILAATAAMVGWSVVGGRVEGVGRRVAASLRPTADAFRLAGMYAREAGGGLTGLKAGLSALSGGLSKGQVAAGGLKSAGSALFGLMGGPWGVAITGATLLVTAWAQANANSKADVDTLMKSIDQATGKFTEMSRKFVAENISFNVKPEDLAGLESLGFRLSDITDAALGTNDQYQAMRARLSEVANGNSEFTQVASGTITALDNMHVKAQESSTQWQIYNKLTGQAADATQSVTEKSDDAIRSLDIVAISTKFAADAARTAADQHKDLADALNEVTDAAVGADQAQIGYEQAVDDASAAVKENGRTLNVNTEAGRKNKEALITLAEKARDAAKAQLENGTSVAKTGQQMDVARAQFVKNAMQMGLNKSAAETLATKYGLTRGKVDELNTSIGKTPKQKVTDVQVKTAAANAAISGVKTALAGIHNRSVVVSITTVGKQVLDAAAAIMRQFGGKRAKGGPVRAGVPYLVGENSDGSINATSELFMPNSPGTILNASQTQAYFAGRGTPVGGGGGGDVFVATINLRAADGRLMQQELLTFKRQLGGGALGLA